MWKVGKDSGWGEGVWPCTHYSCIGKRTIGVLTKLDLMDAGTNALDVLMGRSYPLKLGFVGVVNRSQQDILTNRPMEDAIRAENDFFHQHAAYRSIASRCGSQYLSKQLNNVRISIVAHTSPNKSFAL